MWSGLSEFGQVFLSGSKNAENQTKTALLQKKKS
jgi:hypothetical protein